MPRICVTTNDRLVEQGLIARGFKWCGKDERYELTTRASSPSFQFCLRMQAESKLTLTDHDSKPIRI